MIESIAGITIWSENSKSLSEFYKNVLELPIHSVRPDFVSFKFGPIRLNIGSHSKVRSRAPDPFRIMLNLSVNDIKNTYEILLTKKVKFIRPPEKEHWGGWVATFFDTDGNYVLRKHEIQ